MLMVAIVGEHATTALGIDSYGATALQRPAAAPTSLPSLVSTPLHPLHFCRVRSTAALRLPFRGSDADSRRSGVH